MCMFGSSRTQAAAAAPVLPPETAAMKQPDGNAVKTAAERRTANRVSGATGTVGKQIATILTSAKGVTTFAPTEKKTLLGM